jgi:hypothetical protein
MFGVLSICVHSLIVGASFTMATRKRQKCEVNIKTHVVARSFSVLFHNVRIVCYTMSLVANFVDVTYEVLDSKIIRDTGPAVIVANHQIIMDALGESE